MRQKCVYGGRGSARGAHSAPQTPRWIWGGKGERERRGEKGLERGRKGNGKYREVWNGEGEGRREEAGREGQIFQRYDDPIRYNFFSSSLVAPFYMYHISEGDACVRRRGHLCHGTMPSPSQRYKTKIADIIEL